MKTLSIMALATCLAASLPGCDDYQRAQLDPYRREGMWRPEGVNAGNIAAQLAEPRDLVRGRGDTGPHYKQATRAVTRIWGGAPAGGAAPPAGGAAGGGGGGPAGGGGGAAALLRGLMPAGSDSP